MAEGKYGIAGVDLAWLAGLLEGEGCFGSVGPCPSRPYKSPYVVLKMVDRDVVERAGALMGCAVQRIHSPSQRKRGEQVQYRLWLYGGRALLLMSELRPLMGERRRARIDELTEAFKSYNVRPELWAQNRIAA